MEVVVVVTLSILMIWSGLIGGQPEGQGCPECNGFPPEITDTEIEEVSTYTFRVDVQWTLKGAPMCCSSVCYLVDWVQVPQPPTTNCSKRTITTTNTNATFYVAILEPELLLLQISAVHSDGNVTTGPCHLVNVTSFTTNSMKYERAKYTDVNVSVVFESCESTGNNFFPPSYELNGDVLHGRELQSHISTSQDGNSAYFSVPNITEDTVLLEYCVLPLMRDICDMCEDVRQDLLLSRSAVEVTLYTYGTTGLPVLSVSATTLTTGITSDSSAIQLSRDVSLQLLLYPILFLTYY